VSSGGKSPRKGSTAGSGRGSMRMRNSKNEALNP
jgi:hypothetical protein